MTAITSPCRFGIRHRVDGTWWAAGTYYWAAWTADSSKARRFACRDDALYVAYSECTADPMDYQADEIPAAVAVA